MAQAGDSIPRQAKQVAAYPPDEMNDPYTPPKSAESSPEVPWGSRFDKVLRWIAALCFVYVGIMRLFSGSPSLPGHWVGTASRLYFAFGVLRHGRKFHLGMVAFIVLEISVQAYFTNMAIAGRYPVTIPVPENAWWLFALSVIPQLVILGCMTMLCLRGGSNKDRAPLMPPSH